MTISAQIIADSISSPKLFGIFPRKGVRLTTFVLRYPRFIHAEFMTHRVFSRNASSSRAIPVAKMIKQVREDPAMPIHWGMNQPGMQAREGLDEPELSLTKTDWFSAARAAADYAEEMARHGAHKQIANRILEPFQHISVIVTATEWDNFFALRDHPDAQPEIQDLARRMRAAMHASTPHVLKTGDWHLPFISDDNLDCCLDADEARKVSAARCCRVSYLKHDGQPSGFFEDLKLCKDLAGANPIHASPFEHQAQALNHRGFVKNFRGWRQFRDVIEREGLR